MKDMYFCGGYYGNRKAGWKDIAEMSDKEFVAAFEEQFGDLDEDDYNEAVRNGEITSEMLARL